MSIKVRIPSPLRSYTNGVDVVEVPGNNIGEVLSALKDKASGIETRLFKAPNQLNRFVNVYLNDEDIRFLKNLETPVKAGDEVKVVFAPLLNGEPAGLLLEITLPSGETKELPVPAANTFKRTPE